MAYDVSNIISLTTTISSSGLGTANFSSALFVCPADEIPSGEVADTYKTYSLSSIKTDFASTTETYDALVNYWFSTSPTMSEVIVWFRNSEDTDWATTLDKARNKTWWYWTFVDQDTYADTAQVLEIAQWCNSGESMFVNCQTGTNCEAIRDESDDTDIATQLTTLGYRFATTFTHASDPYAGISMVKWLARVNYSGTNTCTDADFKTMSGVESEDLETSEYTAMKQDTKKAGFYTTVSLQGSTDVGAIMNTWSHSSYGEYLDDVVNVSAISNAVNVAVYNFLRGQSTKAPQTTAGQAGILRAVEQVGAQFYTNGYLGERSYTDPDTGEDAYTETGFVMLSTAEDILDISSTDRAARKAATVKYRLYPSGSIRYVEIEQTIYNS